MAFPCGEKLLDAPEIMQIASPIPLWGIPTGTPTLGVRAGGLLPINEIESGYVTAQAALPF
jgi:hypothetical protein